MALTWTPEMGNAASNPALEQVTRAAIIAACDFREHNEAIPIFDGSTFLVPQNPAAANLALTCLAGVPDDLTGIERNAILSIAASAADLHKRHGGGDAGWAQVGAELNRSRKRIANKKLG